METSKLKKFAQFARRALMEQVSTKLEFVFADDSAARRENADAIKKLEEAIDDKGKDQVIEHVAYIWFNRFCALRFMDVKRYSRIGVVSPVEGQFQPEILADAKSRLIDEEIVPESARQKVFDLLDGSAPSHDAQGEAYGLLVVAVCNFWNKAMPFLFQKIDDYTELLMPDDLLSGDSILAYTREAMTPNACKDVEVLGWLYQFYISEKKDEVFAGLKKKKKITPENIPAATQLFTPHYIVRYLVENSLGRLWMLNRPNSELAEKMDYYIGPEQPETDFLRITKPEEIKICDPACGSGHMLTYAFDLLYEIYKGENYDPDEIPEKILTHNLYGIEIDERAGELAAFALTMKAVAYFKGVKQRRFFKKAIKPNICVLENVHFDDDELKNYMDYVGRDLFTAPLQTTLHQFEEADNFGSLIRPVVTDADSVLGILESKDPSGQLFLSKTHAKVLQTLRQTDYLSPKYHVVVANPPYMGPKGMNARLSAWAKLAFANSKSDLYSMFIERNFDLAIPNGTIAMITMHSWMFLSSYVRLRETLLTNRSIVSMAHIGARGFDSIGGEIVQTTAFIIDNSNTQKHGIYYRLTKGESEKEKKTLLLDAIICGSSDNTFRVPHSVFEQLPSKQISYWVTKRFSESFLEMPSLGDGSSPKKGMITSDNNRFLRYWFEVETCKTMFEATSREESAESGKKWFPYNKGGGKRKWFGNNEYLINWEFDGKEVIDYNAKLYGSASRQIQNTRYYFRPSLTWSAISSSGFSVRVCPSGFIFDSKGPSIFETKYNIDYIHAFCCSSIADYYLSALNSTMDYLIANVSALPIANEELVGDRPRALAWSAQKLAKNDWDSNDTSWDFTILPLINPAYRQSTVETTYRKLRAHWSESTLEMQRLEEENNSIFIDAYGLQDELTPEVPLNEITLTCNPHNRYGKGKSDDELEILLMADTIRELVSYAVGCMFGRYSLDKPGLILANQGEAIEEYNDQISGPSFSADDDNVIPMLDGDWFTDDITERFIGFLRVAFGEEHYEENLVFVEQALNIKGKRDYSIRDYFLKEFYNDHVKRYKKRPIYWLFSSPKGSFNALIYMHRYRPDTVSVVLNDYLREYRTKLTSNKNHLEAVSIAGNTGQGDKAKALKEIEKIKKVITELEEYEHDAIYPLATEQVEIDLDDGVKVNYPKLGAALKKITGLS